LTVKTLFLALTIALVAQTAQAGDAASITGFMNTSGTVEVNGFRQPKSIGTVYFSNDPTETATILAYVSLKRLGLHKPTMQFSNAAGEQFDSCSDFEANVTKLPWIYTITCSWGGRLPSGGIVVSLFDTFNNKTEKLGELYLPEKK
jgi:hypothetical protein